MAALFLCVAFFVAFWGGKTFGAFFCVVLFFLRAQGLQTLYRVLHLGERFVKVCSAVAPLAQGVAEFRAERPVAAVQGENDHYVVPAHVLQTLADALRRVARLFAVCAAVGFCLFDISFQLFVFKGDHGRSPFFNYYITTIVASQVFLLRL